MSEECTGPTVSLEKAQHDVLAALRRAALLHTSLCKVAEAEMGPEAARAFVSRVIDHYGEHVGKAAAARAEAKGLSNDLANWDEDLPSLGFDSKKVSVVPKVSRINNCPLANIWREEGIEEMGSLYCRVDQAKYRAFNPDLTCTHTVHILRDGTDYCEVTVVPKEEKD